MLACARIGAVHPVVFGGFTARNLAPYIDDAEPKLLICADAGIRGGKVIPYKPLVDAASAEAVSPPADVLAVSRGLDPQYTGIEGRDLGYATRRTQYEGALIDLDGSNPTNPAICFTPSAPLVNRSAFNATSVTQSHSHSRCGRSRRAPGPGDVFHVPCRLGRWPLIAGATSMLYEGLSVNPEPAIWRRIGAARRRTTWCGGAAGARVCRQRITKTRPGNRCDIRYWLGGTARSR